jgi:hypothetical protein
MLCLWRKHATRWLLAAGGPAPWGGGSLGASHASPPGGPVLCRCSQYQHAPKASVCGSRTGHYCIDRGMPPSAPGLASPAGRPHSTLMQYWARARACLGSKTCHRRRKGGVSKPMRAGELESCLPCTPVSMHSDPAPAPRVPCLRELCTQLVCSSCCCMPGSNVYGLPCPIARTPGRCHPLPASCLLRPPPSARARLATLRPWSWTPSWPRCAAPGSRSSRPRPGSPAGCPPERTEPQALAAQPPAAAGWRGAAGLDRRRRSTASGAGRIRPAVLPPVTVSAARPGSAAQPGHAPPAQSCG